MSTPSINYSAVRAFNKAIRIAALDEGHAANIAIDGGEWSESESWQLQLRDALRIASRIARRYGMGGHALVMQATAAEFMEYDRMVNGLRTQHLNKVLYR